MRRVVCKYLLGVVVGSVAVATETIVGGVPLEGEGGQTSVVGFCEAGIPNSDGRMRIAMQNFEPSGLTLQVSKLPQDWDQSTC